MSEENIVRKEKKTIKKINGALEHKGKKKEKAHDFGKSFMKDDKEMKLDKSGKPLTPTPAPYDCFYIMYPEKDAKGQDVVLEIEERDKYFPKKTGIYNVQFHPFEGNLDGEHEDSHVKLQ